MTRADAAQTKAFNSMKGRARSIPVLRGWTAHPLSTFCVLLLVAASLPPLVLFCSSLGLVVHALHTNVEISSWPMLFGEALGGGIASLLAGTRMEAGLTRDEVLHGLPWLILAAGSLTFLLGGLERVLTERLANLISFDLQLRWLSQRLHPETLRPGTHTAPAWEQVSAASTRSQLVQISTLLKGLALVAWLLVLDLQLFLLLAAIFVPTAILNHFILSRLSAFRTLPLSHESQKHSVIEEKVHGISTIRMFELQEREMRRLEQQQRRLLGEVRSRLRLRLAGSGLTVWLAWIAIALSAISGVRRIAEGRLPAVVFSQILVTGVALGLIWRPRQDRKPARRQEPDGWTESGTRPQGTAAPQAFNVGLAPNDVLVFQGVHTSELLTVLPKLLSESETGGEVAPAPNPLELPTSSLLENVLYPMRATEQDPTTTERAVWALSRVHLQESVTMPLRTVSSRVRWLTALARAVFHQPDCLLLTEPDEALSEEDLQILRGLLDNELRTVVVLTTLAHANWGSRRVRHLDWSTVVP